MAELSCELCGKALRCVLCHMCSANQIEGDQTMSQPAELSKTELGNACWNTAVLHQIELRLSKIEGLRSEVGELAGKLHPGPKVKEFQEIFERDV